MVTKITCFIFCQIVCWDAAHNNSQYFVLVLALISLHPQEQFKVYNIHKHLLVFSQRTYKYLCGPAEERLLAVLQVRGSIPSWGETIFFSTFIHTVGDFWTYDMYVTESICCALSYLQSMIVCVVIFSEFSYVPVTSGEDHR